MEIYRQDPNVQTRSEIYQKSWNEIKKHPILGIGWGNIGSILGKDERGTPLNSSNIFLETWLGAGIIGILCLVIFLTHILYSSVRKYYYSSDDSSKLINLFFIISFFAIIIPNLFNAGIFLGFFWVWLAITQINNN
jgi:O-antigen ligase